MRRRQLGGTHSISIDVLWDFSQLYNKVENFGTHEPCPEGFLYLSIFSFHQAPTAASGSEEILTCLQPTPSPRPAARLRNAGFAAVRRPRCGVLPVFVVANCEGLSASVFVCMRASVCVCVHARVPT